MLHEADLGIIARDPALPGLRLVLDPDAMLAALRGVPGYEDTTSVEIGYLRYKPGTSCAAALVLTRASGLREYRFFKALTRARFEQSWNHPKRVALVKAGGPDRPQALIEDAGIMLHPAHDRTIPALKIFLDKARSQSELKDFLPHMKKHRPVDWQLLRYKPGRRAVIGLVQQNRPLAVLRCGTGDEFGAMLVGASVGVALGHVTIVGILGRRCMLATDWVEGESLGPENGAALDMDVMVQIGKTLAKVHDAPFSIPRVRSIADVALEMDRVFDVFKVVYPQRAKRFEMLSQRLAPLLQDDDPVLLHGDFSADQVIKSVKGKKLRIIDWDHCAMGNSLIDLASFQARLELQAISGMIGDEAAGQVMDAFLTGYSGKRNVDQALLPRFVAWALLCLATEPFRARVQNWPEIIDRLLARVEALMAGTVVKADGKEAKFAAVLEHVPKSVKRFSDQDVRKNKELEHVPKSVKRFSDQDVRKNKELEHGHDSTLSGRALVNPAQELDLLTRLAEMQTPLVGALQLPDDSRLLSCRVMRHKVGRRALIEYKIQVPEENRPRFIVGKYRRKGLDRHGYACQKALWRNGFGRESVYRVPKPLARLGDYHLWCQEKVEGDPLSEHLYRANPHLARLGSDVGTAIARLHANDGLAQICSDKHWTMADELAVLKRGFVQVCEKNPHWQMRLDALFSGLEKLAQTCVTNEIRPVHRDFYPDQLLVGYDDSQRLILLDFDLCAMSHPALDAGNYLAHVQEYALRLTGDITHFIVHEEAFTKAFLAASGHSSASVVEDFTLVSLVRHIYLSTQFADRRHTTSLLLDICENALRQKGVI